MLKLFTVLGILVVAAPTLAAADNQKNNSSLQNSNSNSQNLNGVPFTANDPPAANDNSGGRPAIAKGNPNCQPASP